MISDYISAGKILRGMEPVADCKTKELLEKVSFSWFCANLLGASNI
jgi:hypothetical protein